jgi:hypothetical protein
MRIGSVLTHVGEALFEGLLLSLLVVALIVGTAFAAGKGGGGGGGGPHQKPGSGGNGTATVSVAPDPVPSYSTFAITGCGYKPSAGVQFTLYAPGGTAVWGGMADANGCLMNATGWANAAGSAKLQVLEGSVTVVATETFTIQ